MCTFIGVWKPWSISTSKSCSALPVSHRLTSPNISPTTNILKPNRPTNCFIVTIRRLILFSSTSPSEKRNASDGASKFPASCCTTSQKQEDCIDSEPSEGACWWRAMCFLCLCSAFSQPDSAADTTMQEFHFICQFLFQRDLKRASPGGNHENQTWVVYLFHFLPALSTHQFCLA